VVVGLVSPPQAVKAIVARTAAAARNARIILLLKKVEVRSGTSGMHLYTMRCVPIGTQLHTCDHLVLAQLRLPSEFEAAAEFVRPDDIARKIRCSSSVEQHLDWLLS
jgi:hypothetical protein